VPRARDQVVGGEVVVDERPLEVDAVQIAASWASSRRRVRGGPARAPGRTKAKVAEQPRRRRVFARRIAVRLWEHLDGLLEPRC
jgi:hypothetical protein